MANLGRKQSEWLLWRRWNKAFWWGHPTTILPQSESQEANEILEIHKDIICPKIKGYTQSSFLTNCCLPLVMEAAEKRPTCASCLWLKASAHVWQIKLLTSVPIGGRFAVLLRLLFYSLPARPAPYPVSLVWSLDRVA